MYQLTSTAVILKLYMSPSGLARGSSSVPVPDMRISGANHLEYTAFSIVQNGGNGSMFMHGSAIHAFPSSEMRMFDW